MRIIIGVLLLFASNAFCQEFEGLSNPVAIKLTAKDAQAPDVFMVYKNSGAVTASGKVEVQFRILDNNGITEVLVNQQIVPTTDADTLVIPYQFSPNEEVEVRAKDKFNNVKEKTFIIRSQNKTETVTPATVQSRFHALIIGIDAYKDPNIAALSDPIKDATSLKELLISSYTFEEKNIIFLRNPTYADLIITFEDLSSDIGPGDLLLIFYAGHGYYNEQTHIGYWLPVDAEKSNTVKWFRNSTLVENIRAINSKHTLLISDACFSGSIFKTRDAFNNANNEINNLLKRRSRKAITSGSLTTVPDKSIFMRYLLKTLTENNNKYLTSEALFDEIQLGMRNNAATRPQFGEIQNADDEGGNFVFIRKD